MNVLLEKTLDTTILYVPFIKVYSPMNFSFPTSILTHYLPHSQVEQDLVGSCNDAASYCGIRDRKYPDRKAMGYPFDRPNPVRSLNEFLRPNMAVRECTINFTDATRVRGQRT